MSLYLENDANTVYEKEQSRIRTLIYKNEFKEEIMILKEEIERQKKEKNFLISKYETEIKKFNILPTLFKPDGNKKRFYEAYNEYFFRI